MSSERAQATDEFEHVVPEQQAVNQFEHHFAQREQQMEKAPAPKEAPPSPDGEVFDTAVKVPAGFKEVKPFEDVEPATKVTKAPVIDVTRRDRNEVVALETKVTKADDKVDALKKATRTKELKYKKAMAAVAKANAALKASEASQHA